MTTNDGNSPADAGNDGAQSQDNGQGEGADGEGTVLGAGANQDGQGEGQGSDDSGDGDKTALGAAGEKSGDDDGGDGEGGAPEEYEDFTIAEGQELDAAMVEKFTPVAKELGLTQANAQKLVDLYAGEVARANEANQQAFAELKSGWLKEAKSDAEVGGAKWNETMSHADKAIKAFGDPELREALDFTGVGNHPALIRFFAKVGSKLVEDTTDLNGNPPGGDVSTSRAERMYGQKAG